MRYRAGSAGPPGFERAIAIARSLAKLGLRLRDQRRRRRPAFGHETERTHQPLMREIVAESRVFARLHKQIMFALSSKYSLALYEMIRVSSKAVVLIEPQDGYIDLPIGKGKHLATYEDSGNYVYTLSKRELEKVALGLGLPAVATKNICDVFSEKIHVLCHVIGL